jgi:putative membrane protein
VHPSSRQDFVIEMRSPPLPRSRNDGREPDYRFSLANERTFLAWLRTSLALLAAAVAVVQVVPSSQLRVTRDLLGLLLATLGLAVSALAYRRWAANERAMREEQPLPRSRLHVTTAIGLTIVGVIVVVALIETVAR